MAETERWQPSASATVLLDSESDLVATSPAGKEEALTAASLPLSFPRSWPAVFKESATLKQLINKKGLNGVRCRAVVLTCPAMEDARATAAAITADLRPLHSFDNAAKLHEAFGWPVVKGFLVLERPDKEAGSAYLALRHWWNATADGAWIDLTPPLDESWTQPPHRVETDEPRELLVESALGEKAVTELTPERRAFAAALAHRLAEGGCSGEFVAGEFVAGGKKLMKAANAKAKAETSEAKAAPVTSTKVEAAETKTEKVETARAFIASAKFVGAKDGYSFKTGEHGTGYYFEGVDEATDSLRRVVDLTDDLTDGAAAEPASAPQAMTLAECARCDGCGAPALSGDAASAARAAKAAATSALRNGDLPAAACLYLEAAQREPTAHTHLSNLSLVLLKLHQAAGGGAVADGNLNSGSGGSGGGRGGSGGSGGGSGGSSGSSGGGGAAVHAAWAARRCIRLEPSFAKGYFRLGSALLAMPGRLAAAASAFEAGLSHAGGGAEEAELRAELSKATAELVGGGDGSDGSNRSGGSSGGRHHEFHRVSATGGATAFLEEDDDEEAAAAHAKAFVARLDAQSLERARSITGGLSVCAECQFALCATCLSNEAVRMTAAYAARLRIPHTKARHCVLLCNMPSRRPPSPHPMLTTLCS